MKVVYEFVTKTKPFRFDVPRPEGFVVREIIDRNAIKKYGKNYNYAIFLMKKKGMNTMDVLKKLSHLLGVSVREIGFAGLKDRNAITYQYISVRKNLASKVKNFDNVEFTFVSFGRKLKPGDLLGNKFEITLVPMPDERFRKEFSNQQLFPNYFGIQRFGVKRQNHVIGYHILRREFSLAEEMAGRRIADRYEIKFYVNAYQSWIFNKLVSMAIKKDIRGGIAPLPGFDSRPRKSWVWNEIKKIHKEHGIKLDDYKINEYRITVHGSERALFINVKDITFNDKLKFTLPKGSYATVILNEISKVREP